MRGFVDKKTAGFKERVAFYAREAGVAIINDGPIELRIIAYWPMSGSPLKRNPRPESFKTTRPDADNVLKAVSDSLNGIAWKDDAQIACVVVEKYHCAQIDDEGARVTVTIRRLS